MSEDIQRARRLPNRNFISVPELAAAKGVTRVAVLYAIKTGKLRASRVDGKRDWFVHVDDAKAYLGQRRRGDPPPAEAAEATP